MHDLPAALITAAGAAIVAATLRDIFHSLLHPGGRGRLGLLVMRGTWLAFRAIGVRRPGALAVAGPAALVAVLGSWALALATGWALVIWPWMPDAFVFAQGLDPGAHPALTDAAYLSLVTLTTLGFGDITPVDGWLRVLLPLEALLGFALLTASISWLLALYPPLSRRRQLAYELFLLREAARAADVRDVLVGQHALSLYADLTSRLAAVQRDLVTFPVTYYFRDEDERFILAAQVPYLLELADHGASDRQDPALRLRAAMLRRAVDDLAAVTAERFHGHAGASTADVLRAYARDHCVEQRAEAPPVSDRP